MRNLQNKSNLCISSLTILGDILSAAVFLLDFVSKRHTKRPIDVFLDIFLIAALINTIVFLAYSENDVAYAYQYGTAGQEWIDHENNIKIKFLYGPEKPVADAEITTRFNVQDLKTGKPITDFKATVVIVEIETDREIAKVKNMIVQHGSFVIRHIFTNEGNYQVILRIDKPSIFVRELASFSIFVFPAAGNIASGIIYGIVLPSSAVVNLLLIQKRRNRKL